MFIVLKFRLDLYYIWNIVFFWKIIIYNITVQRFIIENIIFSSAINLQKKEHIVSFKIAYSAHDPSNVTQFLLHFSHKTNTNYFFNYFATEHTTYHRNREGSRADKVVTVLLMKRNSRRVFKILQFNFFGNKLFLLRRANELSNSA